MKNYRITALLLIAAMVLSMCACDKKTAENTTAGSDNTSASTTDASLNPTTDSTTAPDSSAVPTTADTDSTTVPTDATTDGQASATDKTDTTGTKTEKPEVTTRKEQTTKAVTTTEKTITTALTTARTTRTRRTQATTAEQTTKTTTSYKTDDTADNAYDSYGIDSQKRAEYYQKLSSKTNVPIIHISTKDNALILSRDNYTECLVDVFNCEDSYKISAASAGIRVRGNSSAFYGDENQIKRNVVPYRIHFDAKKNMLGMADGEKNKDWVLIKSNWNLVTDYTALNLADAIFDGEYYYSDCRFVYVYINEKFADLYVLCEQTETGKNRINISEPADGYTGTDIGYLLEIDHYYSNEENYFLLNYNNGAAQTDLEGTKKNFKEAGYTIHNKIYSTAQKDFISQYMNNLFKIVYEAINNGKYLMFDKNYNLVSATGTYSNAKETIAAVIDLNSVVDMYMLYEIVHDYDCGIGSFYMTVDFSENAVYPKLTFTAPWDFNWSYNDQSTNKYYAGAFNAKSFVDQYGDRTNPWFVTLMTADWFVDMVKNKWTDAYGSGRISAVFTKVRNEINQNRSDYNIRGDYAVENGENVLNWATERVTWLNSVWSR